MDSILRDARSKYIRHKSSAKNRGIEFKLSFDEWWELWRPHWWNRGVGVGQFCMCRTLDSGAYELGNVRIDTVKGNARTRRIVAFNSKIQERQHANKNTLHVDCEDDDDGWLPAELKNPYRSSSDYR